MGNEKVGGSGSVHDGSAEAKQKSGEAERFMKLSKVMRTGTENEKKNAMEEACQRLEYLIREIMMCRFYRYVETDPDYQEDLKAAAYCGIMEALVGYDCAKGGPGTYFYLHILHEMVDETGRMKHASSMYNTRVRLKMRETDRQFEQWGRKPDQGDYAYMTGLSVNTIKNAQAVSSGEQMKVSIEEQTEEICGNPDSSSFFMNPEIIAMKKEAYCILHDKMRQKFTKRERLVFSWYLDGKKISSIASRLGEKEERIRCVIETCRKTLKYDTEIQELFDVEAYCGLDR